MNRLELITVWLKCVEIASKMKPNASTDEIKKIANDLYEDCLSLKSKL